MTDTQNSSARLGESIIGLFFNGGGSAISILSKVKKWRFSEALTLISPLQLSVAAAFGSLAGMGIIAIINAAIYDSESVQLPILFVILLLIYRTSQLAFLNSCCAAVEKTLEQRRLDSGKKLSKLELLSVEVMDKSEIQAGLTKNFDTVYYTLINVISGIRASTLALLLLLYLAYISLIAAVICIITSFVCAAVYFNISSEIKQSRVESSDSEIGLLKVIEELTSGIKELRLDEKKRSLLLDDLNISVKKAADARISLSSLFNYLTVFTNVLNYLFVGSIVFILPLMGGAGHGDIARIVAVVLFLIGPLSVAVESIQQISLLKFSLENIQNFEKLLDTLQPAPFVSKQIISFNLLEIKNVIFSRKNVYGDKGFTIGPISLSLSKQQITFIEGSNGSGKTTVMRVISGLYPKDSGAIKVDGQDISNNELGSYRELFGIIFSDFYLFKKPYGLNEIQLQNFKDYLKLLEIDRFLPEDPLVDLGADRLSTGQKKRLALALLLAEDRPIFILDQWAADQDPYFREVFYLQILPKLKQNGKAVIAITHDDRYFHLADQRFHMEDGQLTPV